MTETSASNNRPAIFLLGAALVGLAFSAVLYGEYQTGGLVCTSGSGCDAVRASAFSSLVGISLPTLGIGYFLLLIASAVVAPLRMLLVPVATIGAVAGVLFVGLQAFVIGAFCSLCLVVDVAAVAAAVFAWQASPEALATLRLSPLLGGLTVAAVGLAFVSPLLAPERVAQPVSSAVPGEVAEELKAEGPLTIVEFIDFECPACRMQHQVFEEALAGFEHEVNMVYMHAPLPQHANAEIASRVYICVEETPAAPAMAAAMFTLSDVSQPVLENLAQENGLDVDELRQCVRSEATDQRLARDRSLGERLQVRSLPTFWVGRQKFVGVSDAQTVRRTMEKFVRPTASPQ